MRSLDLTPFGFTPTESLMYEILLVHGDGTGYALARHANLARANAYAALEGLVTKGAARADEGRPRRYAAEAAATLIARLASDQGRSLEKLRTALEQLQKGTESPTLVELGGARAVLQLLNHELPRATRAVRLLAPSEAFPLVAPALSRAQAGGAVLTLRSPGAAALGFADVRRVTVPEGTWPGDPLVCVMDETSAIIAGRQGADVRGHWSTAPTFVAAARMSFDGLGAERPGAT